MYKIKGRLFPVMISELILRGYCTILANLSNGLNLGYSDFVGFLPSIAPIFLHPRVVFWGQLCIKFKDCSLYFFACLHVNIIAFTLLTLPVFVCCVCVQYEEVSMPKTYLLVFCTTTVHTTYSILHTLSIGTHSSLYILFVGTGKITTNFTKLVTVYRTIQTL
jgi:hypothetical protein